MAEALGDTAAPAVKPPRPIHVPMIVAVATLVGVIGVAVLAIVFDIERIGIIDRLQSGADLFTTSAADQASAQASDNHVTLAATLEQIATIAAGLAFVRWFYVGYANLARLRGTYPSYRQGWAIGAWFIPFFNLVRPKQIADDLWRKSDPAADDPRQEPPVRVDPLVHWWWASFLLAAWVGRIIYAEMGTDTLDALQGRTSVHIAVELASIVAAVLAILVVIRISGRQETRMEHALGAAAQP